MYTCKDYTVCTIIDLSILELGDWIGYSEDRPCFIHGWTQVELILTHNSSIAHFGMFTYIILYVVPAVLRELLTKIGVFRSGTAPR